MLASKNAVFSDSKPHISSLEHASIIKFGDQWKDMINFTSKKKLGSNYLFWLNYCAYAEKNPFFGAFSTPLDFLCYIFLIPCHQIWLKVKLGW